MPQIKGDSNRMPLLNQPRLTVVKLLKRLFAKVRFRGKGTILSFICPKNEIIDIDLFGYVFRCDLSEWIQRSIFLYGYDEEALHFIEKNLKNGDIFVDIGANVGFYSLLASSLVGENGRVIAIEPSAAICAKLKETIERNSIHNILILNIGLGKEHGFLNLYSNPMSRNSSATMVAYDAPEVTRVEVDTLDSISQKYQLDEIAYIKIDVEGFEPDVIEGAKILLQNGRIRVIQSEFNAYWLQKHGSSPQKLHDSLLASGFEDAEGSPNFVSNCIVDRFFIRQ